MGAFAIGFISIILITELHSTNTAPVPELSVKLLCELLCEHCNGVSSMESGHCNCEVPEAHFKDNSPCLERAQISAAEMNLKLTHYKNTRLERSVSDLLGTINSKTLEDEQINYSNGYNKMADQSLTPPTPNPMYVNESEDPMPERKEMFVKRSINNVPAAELNKVNGYQEKSTENESLKKQAINYFQTTTIDALYNKRSRKSMPRSSIFSGSNSRSAKLSVFYPQRKKRSFSKRVQFERNEDREITKSNENYDVIVNVQADITIPALKAKQVDGENIINSKLREKDDLPSQVSQVDDENNINSKLREKDDLPSQVSQVDNENNINSKLREKDDLPSQVSPPLVSDNSTTIKSEQSNARQKYLERMRNKITSFISFGTYKAPNRTDVVVSNKSRSAVEQPFLNNGESDTSKATDLIDDSLQSKSGLPSLPTLKLPKLLSRCKLRSQIENKILQRSKLNELKSRLEKLLPREQARIPLQSLLPTNELLKVPKSSAITENNPVAKLVTLFSIPKSSPSLGISKNTAVEDLLTRGSVNGLKLKDEGVGMTLLEKIKNNQLKLKQNLLRVKCEQLPAQNRDSDECQFENENSNLPVKLNPSVPIETTAHESTVDCDDESSDDVAPPMEPTDKFRSNSQKTESVGDEIRSDAPVILPVSQESRSTSSIPTAFRGDSFVPTALPNVDVGKIGLINETKHEGNKHKPITNIRQSSSEPSKQGNDSNISPIQHALADKSITINTLNSKSAHNPPLSSDSNDNQHPEKLQEPFVAGNVETVPTDVSSTAPVLGLEPHAMHIEEPSHTTNDNIINAKETPSNHPHFVNHNENNFLPKTPNYFSPVFMTPVLGNNIRMSPEETYRGRFDPASFHNDMQRIYYPALLARNDLSNAERDSVLNRPVVMIPTFDHPSRLAGNINGARVNPTNEQSGMIMNAFLPVDSHPNNPANLPPSSVFVLKPLLTPDGKIPFPELLNQIRTGNAVIQIYPINPADVDNSEM